MAMAEDRNIAAENESTQTETSHSAENPQDPGRRQFINQALAVSGGIALSGLIPYEVKALASQVTPPSCTPILGTELMNPGEIPSGADGVLHSVLRVHAEDRLVSYLDVNVPNPPNPPNAACGTFKLRAYEGYKGTKVDKSHLVTKSGVFSPGPTFRASVGDTIQIALLNHIDPNDFPETADKLCDQVKNSSGTNIYPGVAPKPPCPDSYPDCFRGSNTTNMHFHGTHVSPNAFSDNVLVEVIPDLKSTPLECVKLFKTVACKDYLTPRAWQHQDAATTSGLKQLIAANQLRLRALPAEKFDPDLHGRQAKQN